jgi:hypothetical protein
MQVTVKYIIGGLHDIYAMVISGNARSASTFDFTGATAAQLIEAILIECRKELWGEGLPGTWNGKEWAPVGFLALDMGELANQLRPDFLDFVDL